jgi:hypothetical protein
MSLMIQWRYFHIGEFTDSFLVSVNQHIAKVFA